MSDPPAWLNWLSGVAGITGLTLGSVITFFSWLLGRLLGDVPPVPRPEPIQPVRRPRQRVTIASETRKGLYHWFVQTDRSVANHVLGLVAGTVLIFISCLLYFDNDLRYTTLPILRKLYSFMGYGIALSGLVLVFAAFRLRLRIRYENAVLAAEADHP